MEANKPFKRIKKPIPNSMSVTDDIHLLHDKLYLMMTFSESFRRLSWKAPAEHGADMQSQAEPWNEESRNICTGPLREPVSIPSRGMAISSPMQ